MADNLKDRVQIQTYSMTFFNEDRQKLNLVYLEDAITVTINFPQVTDGKVTYPKEMRHSVLLNQNNVSAMHTLIMDEILPAFAAGKNKDAGVFTNRAQNQMFEVLVEGGFFHVVIHEEIENCTPKNTYLFKFDKTRVIKDYDPKAVSFQTEDIDAQFTLFVKALEAFENLSNGITAHEYQYRQAYFIDQVKQYLYALDNKLNLNVGRKHTGGSYNNNNGGFSSNSGGGNTSPSPLVINEGTMEDIFPGGMPFN